jgi:hypothetical protein
VTVSLFYWTGLLFFTSSFPISFSLDLTELHAPPLIWDIVFLPPLARHRCWATIAWPNSPCLSQWSVELTVNRLFMGTKKTEKTTKSSVSVRRALNHAQADRSSTLKVGQCQEGWLVYELLWLLWTYPPS